MSELNASYANALGGITPGGRLTLTSGAPVTSSDVSGATSIYYTPYQHTTISLWTGTTWHPVQFSETTLALGTLSSGKPYDVFGYLNAGALALESLAWTDDTTRATAISIQGGRYCKTGDKTRLYLGTFYTTSTTTTEDSKGKRYVFNMYCRVTRYQSVIDSTDSWTYGTAAFRQANNSAANQIEYVDGVGEVAVSANVHSLVVNTTSGAAYTGGIGLDSTTVNSAQVFGRLVGPGFLYETEVFYAGIPGAGRHMLTWLEYATAGGSPSWKGDNATPTITQSGLVATLNRM